MTERRGLRLLAQHIAFGGLVILVAVPVSFALDPAHRSVVVRLSAALIVGLILIDLIGMVRARFEAQSPSAFESALGPGAAPVVIDPHFREVRDEIRAGVASEMYFSRVLWPRLLALADRLPERPALALPARSRNRALFRRGPSVAALRRLIAVLEERA